jgi:hypothetical protein
MREFLCICGAIFLILATFILTHAAGIICAFLGIFLIAMSTRVGERSVRV